jgi:4-amino-4-deoxy-L-arabinose transferase-like glycosyltransferase
MFTFMGSAVNTDVLLVLIYTLLIYFGLRVMQDGLNARRAVAIGLALGSGMLTKPIIMGALPALAIAFLWDLWQRRGQWRTRVVWWLLVGLVAGSVCGGWLIRSTMLTGSPFYGDAMEQYGLSPHPLPDFSLLDYLRSYSGIQLTLLCLTYWAMFGWLDTPLHPSLYIGLLRVVALSLIGLVWTGARAILRRRWQTFDAVLTGYIVTAAWVLLPLYGVYEFIFIRANGMGRGYQGRYFLGPLSVQMLLFAIGLLALVPGRWHTAGHRILRATIMVFNLFCLIVVIIPRYYL